MLNGGKHREKAVTISVFSRPQDRQRPRAGYEKYSK
jgi:hypothetical protein